MARTKGAIGNREWTEALRRACHELRAADDDDKAKKIKALTLMARRVVTKALGGDMVAAKEVGDRLEGKPTQAVDLAVHEPITCIERIIVDPDRARPEAIVHDVKGESVEVKDATGDGESDEDTRGTKQAPTH